MRRLIAIFVGVSAFALFATAIDWMYRADPATVVPFATCPPEASEIVEPASSPDVSAAPSPAHDIVPFYRRIDAPETIHLCGEFEGAPELLILPRLAGNSFEVRVDGERRFGRGAPERPASFWIQPQLVPLDGLGSGHHRAEIELFGLYDLGVRVEPYLASWKGGGLRAGALEWLSSDLVSIAAGLNLGVGILLLAYGLQRRRQRTEAILFGIAAFAAVLYVPDYIPSDGLLGADLFLLRRKLSLAGSFLFGSSLTYGLELATRSRWRIGPIALGITALLAVTALVSPSHVALKTISTAGAFVFLPLSSYATYLAARFLEPRFAWAWVFFGASTIQLTFSLATGTGYLFLFHFGMLAAALAGGVRMTSQLASIARELGRATHAALTDPLTGARNRAFCETLTIAPGDVVAMVDFDDFKAVNDRHGHERGDRLLVEFVRAARLRLRGTDHVVRMGGDEFALVMKGATLAAARRVVEEVFATWRETAPDLEPKASYGLVEGRAAALDRVLAEADREMYEAKGRRARPPETAADSVAP